MSRRHIVNRVVAGDGDSRHGVYTTYANHQCRCDQCTEAWSSWHHAYMAARPEQRERHRQRAQARTDSLDALVYAMESLMRDAAS